MNDGTIENANIGCLPCFEQRKQCVGRPRKSTMGDGRNYSQKDRAAMKKADSNAPQCAWRNDVDK